MKKIAFKSCKGGVGKTICSFNFAGALNLLGYRILLMDFDFGMSSLSRRLGPKEKGVLQLVNGKYTRPLSLKEGIDFLPVGKGEIPQDKKGIKTLLKLYEKNYDFIVMDLSPEMNLTTDVVLQNADFCIIPSYPDLLSLDGTALTLKYCKEQKVKARILFNRVTPTKLTNLVVGQLKDRFPTLVLENGIKQRVIYAESFMYGTTAVAKNGLAAMDFKDVVLELQDRGML